MILDTAIALLLLVTIVFCWRLSRKVAELNASKREFAEFIGDFNDAIVRANHSVTSLKKLSEETDAELQQHIEKARFLANDLSFLTHKGDGIADKLENYIATSRIADPNPMGLQSVSRTTEKAKPRTPPAQKPQEDPLESDVLDKVKTKAYWKSLNEPKKAAMPAPEPNQEAPKAEMSSSKRAALDTLMEQIAAKRKETGLVDATEETHSPTGLTEPSPTKPSTEQVQDS